MQSATLTHRTLQIDGMTGDACVQKVTAALKGVDGVTTESIRVGSATIAADQDGCDRACFAIGAAGFKAHEGALKGGDARMQSSSVAAGKLRPEVQAADQEAGPMRAAAPESARTTGCDTGCAMDRDSACAPAVKPGLKLN